MAVIQAAGFEQVTVGSERYDVFSDAPSASSAAEFGTQGVNIIGWKPVAADRPSDAGKEVRRHRERNE